MRRKAIDQGPHLEAFLSANDCPRVLEKLDVITRGENLIIGGVAITQGKDPGNIFDVHIIPMEPDTKFLLLFKEALTKKVSIALSEGILRHAMLGMLTTGVSHDINNKLSVILGFTLAFNEKSGR